MSKEIILKTGHYGLNPKDAEDTVMTVPDDSVFITGGPNDIGDGLHCGAVHIMMATRATGKELEKVSKQCFNANIVRYRKGTWQYEDFRINGYGFIHIPDCIPLQGIEFTDSDRFNEMLELAEHPLYTVLLNNDLAICEVSRIDRINSYYSVECKSVRLYTPLGSKYCPAVQSGLRCKLDSIISPFHEFSVHFPDREYGMDLFDEAMYTVISGIYPEYASRLKGYDLDWIRRTAAQTYGPDGMACDMDKFSDTLTFKERLPLLFKVDNANREQK